MSLPLFPTVAEQVTEMADAGHANAVLIEWDRTRNPQKAIEQSILEFTAAGWQWADPELVRAGWYAWFRSQGNNAPPIVQWGKR